RRNRLPGRAFAPRTTGPLRRPRPGRRPARQWAGSSRTQPGEDVGLDDLPGYDFVGGGIVLGGAPLQLTALGVGKERRVRFGRDAVPEGLGERNPLRDAQPLEVVWQWRHGLAPSASRFCPDGSKRRRARRVETDRTTRVSSAFRLYSSGSAG